MGPGRGRQRIGSRHGRPGVGGTVRIVVVPELDIPARLRQVFTMRLPWISQRQSQRSATRRKRSARCASAASNAVACSMPPSPTSSSRRPTSTPSTAVHDSNEGTRSHRLGRRHGHRHAVLRMDAHQGRERRRPGQRPDVPVHAARRRQLLRHAPVTDSDANRSLRAPKTLVVHNVRPVLVVALDQTSQRRSPLDLSAVGGAPPLGLFVDEGLLDTHTATVDWGDGSAIEAADDLRGSRLRRARRHPHLHQRRRLRSHRHGHRRRRRQRHASRSSSR